MSTHFSPVFSAPDDVNPIAASFEPYEPGLAIADIQERFGLNRVIKMASNENMLGVSPRVRDAIRAHADLAFRYPQAGNPRLGRAIAARYGVAPERIFLGNGSDEVIDLLFRVRAVPGVHNAVAFQPCFGLYVTQSRMAGVELRQAALRPDFSLDIPALLRLVDENTSLVLITSPDNPSGRLTPVSDIAELARALPPACLLVVDEAYIEFAGEEHSLLSRLDEFPNVALLRTFSKLYGLAGLRIGYGIYPGKLADYMWRVRLPFSVNSLAEDAALTALTDSSYQEETLRLTRQGREHLTRGLEALGCEVIPSHANFLMFKPGGQDAGSPNPVTAADLHLALLKRGFILRSLNGYGLPQWLRLTVGTEEENTLLLEHCAQILAPSTLSQGERA
jgi:histidinol-phosphate aminotransferase